MALDFWHSSIDEGITIPYPACNDASRTNSGFQDLRGRADLAEEITEAFESPALQVLLKHLANSLSPIFTAGCDLGTHVEDAFPAERREVAGGYVHLVASCFPIVLQDQWDCLCRHLEQRLDAVAADDDWWLNVYLEPMMIGLDNFNDFGVAAKVDFYALAPTHEKALASRERLISAITDALAYDAILTCWKDIDDD